MKKVFSLLFLSAALVSCKNAPDQDLSKTEQPREDAFASYTSVGKEVSAEGILSAAEMSEKFAGLSLGDTIDARFRAEVASVCKSKGCWMNLKLENGEEAAVKFKDYAFFVPKDIEEKEVVVNGKAYVSMESVEDQRHYAEDAGKSKEEIAAITEPKRTLSFMADGVLIEK